MPYVTMLIDGSVPFNVKIHDSLDAAKAAHEADYRVGMDAPPAKPCYDWRARGADSWRAMNPGDNVEAWIIKTSA